MHNPVFFEANFMIQSEKLDFIYVLHRSPFEMITTKRNHTKKLSSNNCSKYEINLGKKTTSVKPKMQW